MKNQKYVDVKPGFGIGLVTVGCVSIYTAKMRFTAQAINALKGLELLPELRRMDSPNGKYTTLSFETTDHDNAKKLWAYLGTICREVAFNKLHAKYAWVTSIGN